VPVRGRKEWYHTYLVTAAHSIRSVQEKAGSLYVRFNTNDGGSAVVETTTDWVFPDDEAVDLALLPYEPSETYEVGPLPLEGFATDELIAHHNFGIGDEIYAMGLFYFRHGKKRNHPVLRTGIVASMPDEPIEDERTGLPYDAYLIEMRSFGGLSGTPVFTVFHEGTLLNRPPRQFSSFVHQLAPIGVIRGHWDLRREVTDAFTEDVEQANVGLAIVTPIQKLTELLWRDDLVRQREEEERALPPPIDDPSST
jgi:hypothetical protein